MGTKRRFRRLWYFRRRNLRCYRMLLCLTTALLIFILMWLHICQNLFPAGLTAYEDKLSEVIQCSVENELTAQYGTIDGINTILDIDKDTGGRITSVKADNIKLNRLSLSIEKELREILIHSQGDIFTSVKAPILPFLNARVNLGGARVTDVETTFVSRFLRESQNTTKLRIYLDVNITYEYLLGNKSKTFEFTILDSFLEG